jgi:hypothetical protein
VHCNVYAHKPIVLVHVVGQKIIYHLQMHSSSVKFHTLIVMCPLLPVHDVLGQQEYILLPLLFQVPMICMLYYHDIIMISLIYV